MDKPILYIIAGANGSGKSTLASELLLSENLEFLNAVCRVQFFAPKQFSISMFFIIKPTVILQ